MCTLYQYLMSSIATHQMCVCYIYMIMIKPLCVRRSTYVISQILQSTLPRFIHILQSTLQSVYTYTTIYITDLVYMYYSIYYRPLIPILQSTVPSFHTYITVYITELVHTAERQRITYLL
jgi:hypothetical protein